MMPTLLRTVVVSLFLAHDAFAQGRDCGSFEWKCAGTEGACNNACYYITCVNRGNANAKRVTYIGNGQTAENDRNRQLSGCQAAQGGSVCRNFPFSQNFIDESHRHLIGRNDCDEWPPAASQQNDFQPGTIRNTLRCIPDSENRAAGARLGNFINDVGSGRGAPRACTGPLKRGDHFDVKFDLTGADQSKLQYCYQGPLTVDCSQDGYQFHMTKKPTQNGKISSFYNPLGTDNRYELSLIAMDKELFQASIFISRPDDRIFNWRITDTGNKDSNMGSHTVIAATGEFVVNGLRTSLAVGKTGPKGTQVTFRYGTQNTDVDYMSWNSDDIGDGRGPGTDAGDPYKYCHETTGSNGEWQTECWFGSYQ